MKAQDMTAVLDRWEELFIKLLAVLDRYQKEYAEAARQFEDMIENHGLVVSELSEGEFEKMREMSQPVYDLVESYDPERYAALMEAAEAANTQFPTE